MSNPELYLTTISGHGLTQEPSLLYSGRRRPILEALPPWKQKHAEESERHCQNANCEIDSVTSFPMMTMSRREKFLKIEMFNRPTQI